MKDYLYEQVNRVPSITDEQIAAMKHIEPVVLGSDGWYRRIPNANKIHARDCAFNWLDGTVGKGFQPGPLNQAEIITQHHSSVFFKASLAEVYAWILFYMPDSWKRVKYFCLGNGERIGTSCDFVSLCILIGGDESEWRWKDGIEPG